MTQPTRLGVDFETYYDDLYSLKKLTTLEYLTDPRFKVHMMGYSLDGGSRTVLPATSIPAFLREVRGDCKNIALLAQNAQFDGQILSKHYGFIADSYICTRAMSRALNPHVSAALGAIAERVWPNDPTMRKGDDLAASKGMVELTPTVYEQLAGYCAQDVHLLEGAYLAMLPAMPAGILEFINLVTQWAVVPTLELDYELMERYIPKLDTERKKLVADSGLWRFAANYRLDTKQRAHFIKQFETALRKGEAKPEDRDYFLSLKVLNSNQAFEAFLSTLQIKVPTKLNKEGKKTLALAQDDPQFIALMQQHPKLEHVWNARASAKSTQALSRAIRFVNTANAFDGRIPVPLQVSAAHTHRLGGTEKLNLQNLERNADDTHPDGDLRPGALRRALLAPEDHVVLVADLSNIEPRMLAYLSDHHVLLEIFATGGDPYSWQASSIYGFQISKKTHPFERNVGKVTILSLGYGAGVDRFTMMLHSGPMGMAPIHFADPTMYRRIVTTYRHTNAPVVSFWNLCGTFIEMMYRKDTHYRWKMLTIEHERIRLPSGLYLHYPNLRPTNQGWVYDSKEEGNATKLYGAKLAENITQALANCVLQEAIVRAEPELRDLGGRSVLQVHDEEVAVAPEDCADEGLRIITNAMTVVPDWCPGIPLACEGGYARNYAK